MSTCPDDVSTRRVFASTRWMPSTNWTCRYATLAVLWHWTPASAATTKGTPGTATPQFASTLKDFQTALLDGNDDQKIAGLRNNVIDMVPIGSTIHLDDAISTTAAARANAAAFCQKLKASQIAASAIHADEVSDPEELLTMTADGLQDNASDPAEKDGDAAATADAMIQETASAVGNLVAGMDESKAHSVAEKASDWLHNVGKLSNADFVKQRQILEDAATKIVGGVSAMSVLNNWLERQIAILLSNPQLSPAIDAMLKIRTQSH